MAAIIYFVIAILMAAIQVSFAKKVEVKKDAEELGAQILLLSIFWPFIVMFIFSSFLVEHLGVLAGGKRSR